MKNFKELGIEDQFIKGLNELNILEPTDIQAKVIPLLLNNTTDLVAQAQTGTGKTAAYGLPLLQIVNPEMKEIQALVLCPTRELSQQVAKQLFRFTKYSVKIFTEAVYGGAPIDQQITNLKRPTQIVVATPGRLIDLLSRKALDLSNVRTVVLDEADEMLSMGFKKELEQILEYTLDAEQKWLFSATLPQGIQQIINTYMSAEREHIEVSGINILNKNILNQYLICKESDKFRELMRFLNAHGKDRGIIFCNTKVAAQQLFEQLKEIKVPVSTIHGDMQQRDREKAMRAFKNESSRLLIATDIAARGLDVADLAFVVHYQFPDQEEYYTHRSGRTARAGKKGISISIITSSELELLEKYQQSLNIDFKQTS